VEVFIKYAGATTQKTDTMKITLLNFGQLLKLVTAQHTMDMGHQHAIQQHLQTISGSRLHGSHDELLYRYDHIPATSTGMGAAS
jgi:hypothetical protein